MLEIFYCDICREGKESLEAHDASVNTRICTDCANTKDKLIAYIFELEDVIQERACGDE